MENKNMRLFNRIREDRGNATIILGLALFGLILLISTFMVDVSKNTWLQSTYSQMATRAAQNGLKEQNNIGGLTPYAAQASVREYLAERNSTGGQTAETVPFRNNCKNKYGVNPTITVEFSTGRKGAATETFKYNNGVFTPSLESRASSFYRTKFRKIQITVNDYGDNYFFSLFGQQCQMYKVTASAISIDADAGQTGD